MLLAIRDPSLMQIPVCLNRSFQALSLPVPVIVILLLLSKGHRVGIQPVKRYLAANSCRRTDPGREPLTPRVAGYGFVSEMPSPSPAEMGRSDLQQLMTLGRLASTPVPLRDGPFKIPATPRREELANKMAREASKSLRNRHGGTLGLPTLVGALTPRGRQSRGSDVSASPRPHTDMLSPAAKTLLNRTGEGKKLTVTKTSRLPSSLRKEIDSQERLRKARWEPSPVGSRST